MCLNRLVKVINSKIICSLPKTKAENLSAVILQFYTILSPPLLTLIWSMWISTSLSGRDVERKSAAGLQINAGCGRQKKRLISLEIKQWSWRPNLSPAPPNSCLCQIKLFTCPHITLRLAHFTEWFLGGRNVSGYNFTPVELVFWEKRKDGGQGDILLKWQSEIKIFM